MANRTVRDIIDQALSLIGVYSIGQTTSNEDTALGLTTLQDLITSFNQDSLLIPFETEDTHTLTASQSSYTIGTTGSPDISAARPDSITDAFVRSGDTDYKLRIISGKDYRKISLKSTASIPEYLYYNPTIGNGTIYLYPAPSSNDVLHITSIKTFTEPTNLTNDITTVLGIPRDYANALKFILAEELMIHYGSNNDRISQKAALYKRRLRNINFGRQISEAEIEPRSTYSTPGPYGYKIPR